jgi:organic hydroperoxide reductase OsmC/OhrA
VGEVELDGRVLILKRVRVLYHLKIDPDRREIAKRVHEIHQEKCPVARSIRGAIEVSTELSMESA